MEQNGFSKNDVIVLNSVCCSRRKPWRAVVGGAWFLVALKKEAEIFSPLVCVIL
jgi:hypothetical protein